MASLLHKRPIGKNLLTAANCIGFSYRAAFSFLTCSQCGYEYASFLRRWGNFSYIGQGAHIATDCTIESPQLAIIGEQAYLGSCVLLAGDSFLDYSLANHPEDAIVIGDFATIGDDVIIHPGVTIGRHANILPGALITSDVEDYSVIYPNQNGHTQTSRSAETARDKALRPALRSTLNA